MKRTFSEELEGFSACAWETASLAGAELGRIGAAALAHASGARVLQSCQRVEVYGHGDHACSAPHRAWNIDALLHLAEVAAGLHSAVLGEEQILGQARLALSEAPPEFRRVGQLAIAAARELRAETGFETTTGHLLDRALALAKREARGTAMVAGAGAAGRLVAERAKQLGFGRVIVASRRVPDGAWFANSPSPYEWCELSNASTAGEVDVLVGCLGSGAPELGPIDLPRAALLVDLGTPRNFEPTPGATLVTIADIVASDRANSAHTARREALRDRLRELVERRIQMAREDTATPVGRLRQEAERIRQAEVVRIQRLHPGLPAETIERITQGLVNQLLHGPTQRLRELRDDDLGARLADLFAPADESVAAASPEEALL